MSAPHLKLVYFDIHGLAARIRVACAVGGVPLEDVRLPREDFDRMKVSGELPFGQVPILIVDGDRARIAQSSSILRYVCTLGGLHPTDALAAAAVDSALASESDAFASYGSVRYRNRNGLGHLDAAAVSAAEDAQNESVLPRHLGYLEAALGISSTGWVAGTAKPSAADFAWGTSLRELRVGKYGFLRAELLASTPHINAFLDKFLAIPEVIAYYKD